eukprot:gene10327-11431_t
MTAKQSNSNWETELFPSDEQASSIRVGQRLGVPYTRSLQESLSIHLPACPQNMQQLVVAQDGFGVLAISGVVWDCALLMADYLHHLLSSGSSLPSISTVLDLGCGTGICGLIAGHLFHPSTLVFSDKHQTSSLESNRDLLSSELKESNPAAATYGVFIAYDWSEPCLPSLLADTPWDIVLCSDLLYDAKYHSGLLHCLQSLSFQRILLTYKKRHEEEEKVFFSQLATFCSLRVIPIDSFPSINLPDSCRSALYLIEAIPLSSSANPTV